MQDMRPDKSTDAWTDEQLAQWERELEEYERNEAEREADRGLWWDDNGGLS